MRLTIPGVLTCVALAGCATAAPARVDDARLARLPAAEREALVDQQREVNLAQSNLDAARVAASDAVKFASIVDSELDAAGSHLAATKKSIDLGHSTQDDTMEASSRDAYAGAQEARDAARAKADYAGRLVKLRRAEVALREAELGQARARLEQAEMEHLRGAGQANDLDPAAFERTRRDAEQRVEKRRHDVDARRSEVARSRASWEELRRHVDVASRGAGADDGAIDAPPPPEPIEPRAR